MTILGSESRAEMLESYVTIHESLRSSQPDHKRLKACIKSIHDQAMRLGMPFEQPADIVDVEHIAKASMRHARRVLEATTASATIRRL